MSRSKLVAAAKVILYINGKPYAQVSSFSWNSASPKRAIYGLDSSEPFELATTTTKIQGKIGLFRLIGDGGAEGVGAIAGLGDIIREKYFSLALIERSTDTQLFRADRCSVTDQSWDVPGKGMMMGSLTFEALDWNNEAAGRVR